MTNLEALAIKTLERLLSNPDPNIQLRAARVLATGPLELRREEIRRKLDAKSCGSYSKPNVNVIFDYQGLPRNLDDGNLDKESYRRQIENIRKERIRFTDLLEKANATIDTAYLHSAKTILHLCTLAKELWSEQDRFERRAFLEKLLSNQRLEGSKVRYDLRKPFQVLSDMREKQNWRPHRDSLRAPALRSSQCRRASVRSFLNMFSFGKHSSNPRSLRSLECSHHHMGTPH